MSNFRFLGSAGVISLVILFFCFYCSAGRDASAAQAAESADGPGSMDSRLEPYTVRVEVTAEHYPEPYSTALDVVVLDGRGRQITDLTAADFEVFQDGVIQDVSSAVYINHLADAAAKTSASGKAPAKPAQSPQFAHKSDEVQRSIVFFVDNFLMGYAPLNDAKNAIRGFLDKQMQSGDSVAIIQAVYGGGVRDMFTTDRRELAARVDDLGQSRVSSLSGDSDYTHWATLSHVIRTLKDAPGRKYLFLIFTTPEKLKGGYYNDAEAFGGSLDWMAEEAIRAGVVVHFLHPRASGGADGNFWKPLPARTGGIDVSNNNFYKDGVGKEANTMISGHYKVSYAAPPDTVNDGRDVFHRVTVKVKRRRAEVHTAEGFFGKAETDLESPAYPLRDVIFSPLQNADLNAEMASGWLKDAKAGYLIRTWVHLDAKDVKMAETGRGAGIALETAGMTTDIYGNVHDYDEKKYVIEIKPEDIEWVRKNGIRFTRVFRVNNPGAYTFHLAIRDAGSDKAGSVYQFVNIPDIGVKRPALSDIFMFSGAADHEWMLSDPAEEINKEVMYLELQKDESRNPALRKYKPGDRVNTMMLYYCAGGTDPSEIETLHIKHGQYTKGIYFDADIGQRWVVSSGNDRYGQGLVLGRTDIMPQDYIKDKLTEAGRRKYIGEPISLGGNGAVDMGDNIRVFKRFAIVQDMPAGDYTLVMQILQSDEYTIDRISIDRKETYRDDIPGNPISTIFESHMIDFRLAATPAQRSVNFIIEKK